MTATTMRPRDMRAPSAQPWYRQRWPWLLIAGPAIVVVAGFYTLWLALRTDDGVVADDYYKRGLLINRQIEETRRAAGIEARTVLGADGTVRVALAGVAKGEPATLRLRFAHATRAGLDRTTELRRTATGDYVGAMDPLPAGRWLVSLRSDAWRLPSAEITAPIGEFRLGGELSP